MFARLTDDAGVLRVLAVDHRDSLRAVMGADTPDAALIAFKRDLAAATAGMVSGVMLDPEYGIGPGRASDGLGVGFIAALEAQGYLSDTAAESTTILDGWGVAEAAAAGAAGFKLLVLHDAGISEAQAAVIAHTSAAARHAGLPLFVEPLPVRDPDPAAYLRTVRAIAEAGGDVLKVQACPGLGDAVDKPWALLSAGVDFERFCEQFAAACAEGCSGYIAGRSVWGEAAVATGAERDRLVADVVLPRLDRLNRIATTARPLPR